jgi:hypothetical protein
MNEIMNTTFDMSRITTAVEKARRMQERYGKKLHVLAWKTHNGKTVVLTSYTSTPPRATLLSFPPIGEIKEFPV